MTERFRDVELVRQALASYTETATGDSLSENMEGLRALARLEAELSRQQELWSVQSRMIRLLSREVPDAVRSRLLATIHNERQVGFRDRLVRAQLVTHCREELADLERCGEPAEFILWGKLFPQKALGPRCYEHAAKYVGGRALGDPQWAITDLRPVLEVSP